MKAMKATLQTILTKVLTRVQMLQTAITQQTATILQIATTLLARIKQVTALTNLRA